VPDFSFFFVLQNRPDTPGGFCNNIYKRRKTRFLALRAAVSRRDVLFL
jgi:hypothetical protein